MREGSRDFPEDLRAAYAGRKEKHRATQANLYNRVMARACAHTCTLSCNPYNSTQYVLLFS